MNRVQSMAVWIYRTLLCLTPKRFRQTFENEMIQVFMMGSNHAHREYSFPFCFYYRELRDLPTLVMGEHRSLILEKAHYRLSQITDTSFYLQKEPNKMGHTRNDDRTFDLDRREMIIASLPPIILGLGITTASLITHEPWYTLPQWRLMLSIAILLASGFLIGCGATYALFRRIPDWGYTWVGTAFMGTLLFIQTILGELSDDGKLFISDGAGIALALCFMLIGLIFLFSSAWRGWQRAGMFSIALSFTFALSLWQAVVAAPFNRYDVAIFALPLSLLIAVLIYLYFKGSDTTRILVIFGVAVLNMFVIFIAVAAWDAWLENAGKPSPLLPLVLILTTLLVVGPLAAGIMRPIRSHYGQSST